MNIDELAEKLSSVDSLSGLSNEDIVKSAEELFHKHNLFKNILFKNFLKVFHQQKQILYNLNQNNLLKWQYHHQCYLVLRKLER